MQQDLERRNEELEELYLLEECFPEAEKLKQDTRLLSQVKLILCVCVCHKRKLYSDILFNPLRFLICL